MAAMTVRSRRTFVRLSTVLGVVLAVAGGAFVARRIADSWSESKDVIAGAEWGWLLVAFALASLGMASVGFVWRRVIAALGGDATRREIFVWYQIGQLGKYLPGGLWPVVGRSEMAARGGLRRSIAYNSVALSMGSTYLCATLVCAALLPAIIVTSDSSGTSLWVFALVPIGFTALHPAVLGRIFALAERGAGQGRAAAGPAVAHIGGPRGPPHGVLALHRAVDLVRGLHLRPRRPAAADRVRRSAVVGDGFPRDLRSRRPRRAGSGASRPRRPAPSRPRRRPPSPWCRASCS